MENMLKTSNELSHGAFIIDGNYTVVLMGNAFTCLENVLKIGVTY